MGSLRSLSREGYLIDRRGIIKLNHAIFQDKVVGCNQVDDVIGTLTGIFMLAVQPTISGRVYPPEILKKILEDEGIQSKIKNKTLFGNYLNSEVDMSKSITSLSPSHRIARIYEEPKRSGIGKCTLDILDTKDGWAARALIIGGSSLYPCLSGMGSTNVVDFNSVVNPNDYLFITIHLTPDSSWTHISTI